jgi:cardiolipin synthase
VSPVLRKRPIPPAKRSRRKGRKDARRAVAREDLRYAYDPRELSRGNQIKVLRDGDQTYPAMLRAIEGAESFVHLEVYILEDDTVGELFRDVLCERARDGVTVRLMYDAFGSFSLSSGYLEDLHEAGVITHEYRPLVWRTWGKWGRRDHRKILVVDGRVAFTGGLNIGEEYAPKSVGGHGWRDTHCMVVGPVVKELDAMFFTIWHREGARPYPQPPHLPAPPLEDIEPVEAVAVGSSHRGRRTAIRRRYLWAIRQATDYVYIANAYFVPDRGIVRALIRAARRGVEVRILTSEHSDVKLVQYASAAHFDKLMRNGVHIHLWPETVMHAKTAVIDGAWSTVGSYNLDYVSLFQNLEVIVAAVGRDLGDDIRAMFEQDFARSRELELSEWKQRPWWQKMFEWVCYKIRRYL